MKRFCLPLYVLAALAGSYGLVSWMNGSLWDAGISGAVWGAALVGAELIDYVERRREWMRQYRFQVWLRRTEEAGR